MASIELMPGIKPEDALKAFETIHAELERVRPLNYRSPLFTRWKTIVAGALARFCGPEHVYSKAFQGFVFHGPMPKSPMDPPVSQKDVEGYAAGVESTAALLELILEALRPPTLSADVPPLAAPMDAPMPLPAPVAQAAPVAAVAPSVESGFKLVRGHGADVGRVMGSTDAAPADADPLRSTHDLSRHAGAIPTGGLKIVSRSGVGGAMATIDAYIDQTTDPQEKELLMTLAASVDDPTVTWQTMKHLLAELWWLRRETVQKILPIILRR